MTTWTFIAGNPPHGPPHDQDDSGGDPAPATTRAAPSLAEVYRRHFEFVYRTAARLGGPGFDAEDAAQEVFLVVARKLDTYDSSSEMTTWLYGITLNVVRSARRRAAVRRFLTLRHFGGREEAVRPPDPVEFGDAYRIASEILDRMRTKHREAFILFEFEGLSCEEIARLTGTRTETVWSRLHYARKEFAERLKKRGHGGGK